MIELATASGEGLTCQMEEEESLHLYYEHLLDSSPTLL